MSYLNMKSEALIITIYLTGKKSVSENTRAKQQKIDSMHNCTDSLFKLPVSVEFIGQ